MANIKRGTRCVDWHVQGALIGRTLLHWAWFSIGSFAMVFGLHVLTGVITSSPESSATPILWGMWNQYKVLVISLISLVPFFCLDLILWSHRFVGPMVRIRRVVRDLASGKSAQP